MPCKTWRFLPWTLPILFAIMLFMAALLISEKFKFTYPLLLMSPFICWEVEAPAHHFNYSHIRSTTDYIIHPYWSMRSVFFFASISCWAYSCYTYWQLCRSWSFSWNKAYFKVVLWSTVIWPFLYMRPIKNIIFDSRFGDWSKFKSSSSVLFISTWALLILVGIGCYTCIWSVKLLLACIFMMSNLILWVVY